MKRNLFVFALLLILTLLLPIQAAAQTVAPGYVTDHAGLLSFEEAQSLDAYAKQISEQYNVGVYIITVEDYKDYTNGDVSDAADALYDSLALGMGDNRDGILLLLSMAERDFDLMVEGGFANVAFNTAGREYLAEFFLVEFADNDWNGGFNIFLMWCEDYLLNARNGTPYTSEHVPMEIVDILIDFLLRAAVVLIVPLIVAGSYVAVLSAKMKSVAVATHAAHYVSGGLQLTREIDRFSHITRTRRKIERSNSPNSSSGGTHSKSSGSRSHTSGKF
jgi:uncharacterized membrane protein YgcG